MGNKTIYKLYTNYLHNNSLITSNFRRGAEARDLCEIQTNGSVLPFFRQRKEYG